MVRKKGSLLGYGSQSKVYSFGSSRIMKVGKGLHTYPSLWGSVLPRMFSRGRGYMITERVKTYSESNFRQRKMLRVLEFDFARERHYLEGKIQKIPWYRRFFSTPRIAKAHSAPLFQKWGWQSLLRFPLANLHWRDIRRANLGIRRGKPVILDEGVIKYK